MDVVVYLIPVGIVAISLRLSEATPQEKYRLMMVHPGRMPANLFELAPLLDSHLPNLILSSLTGWGSYC